MNSLHLLKNWLDLGNSITIPAMILISTKLRNHMKYILAQMLNLGMPLHFTFATIFYHSMFQYLLYFIFRYFLKVTVVRRLTDLVKELDLAVHTLSSYPEMNSSIKMEVGIEDSLHIEFEYNKSKYFTLSKYSTLTRFIQSLLLYFLGIILKM